MSFKNFTYLSLFVICIFALNINEAQGTALVRVKTDETLSVWKCYKDIFPEEIAMAIENLIDSIRHTLPPQVVSAMKSIIDGIFFIIKELSPGIYRSLTNIMENMRVINEAMLPKLMVLITKYLKNEGEITTILKHLSMLLRQLVPFIENIVSRLSGTVS